MKYTQRISTTALCFSRVVGFLEFIKSIFDMDLTKKNCVPCRVGEPPLTKPEIDRYIKEVNPEWKLGFEPEKLVREFEFKDFNEAVNFINKVAKIAETEGHHPNICLHNYRKVNLELWTHKIGGLHENDFILASKIDKL